MDGYRRLERTRTVAAPHAAITAAATIDERPSQRRARRRIGKRLTGALRLVVFVLVLAIIVGTSVSLASSNSVRHVTVRSTPDEKVDVSSTTAPTAREESASNSSPSTADAAPASTAAAVPARTAALPRTGTIDVQLIVLAGAALVLLGMAIQIAGEPLPACRTR